MPRSLRFASLVVCLSSALASIISAQTPSISVPAAVSGFPGQTVQLPITVACGTYTGPISVALASLPSGISAAPLNLQSCGSGSIAISLSTHAAAELWPTAYTPLAFIDSETATVQAVAVAGSTRSTASFNLTISINNQAFSPAAASIDLPVVYLSTANNATITTSNTPGNIVITAPNGAGIIPGAASADTVANFFIHGNSTALVPKLSYDVKLNTSTDLLSAMGVSCGYVNSSNTPTCDKSKSYILLASFFDKTFLRHSIAMDLARSIGTTSPFLNAPAATPTPTNNSTITNWAPHSTPVDVYLNGAYQGVYVLIEQIKIDTHRVNITEMSSTDIGNTSKTGGYLMEANFRADLGAATTLTTQYLGSLLGFQLPVTVDDPNPPAPEQKAYMQSTLSAAETALFSPGFTDPATGWQHYFDSPTFVDFFLVNELMENYDSGRMVASAFMYKNRSNNLIYMGPVWDFDVSSGNSFGSTTGIAGDDAQDPTNHYMQTGAPWYKQAFQDPAFVQLVRQQWQALVNTGALEAWFSRITSSGSALTNAVARDDQRWPKFGVPYAISGTTNDTYAQEVAYLEGFLRVRVATLDQQFGPTRPATTVTVTPPASASAEQPATLTAQVVPSEASGTVYFLQNDTLVGSAALTNGRAEVAATLAPGTGTALRAVYAGSPSYMQAVSSVGSITVTPVRSTSSLVLQQPGIAASVGTYTVAAHVVGNNASLTPTGTISINAAGVTSTGRLNSAGDATLTLTAAQACAQPLTAQYTGDTNFLPSTAAQSIPAIEPNTVTLTTPAAIVLINQPFSLAATVTTCGASAAAYNTSLNTAGAPTGLTLPLSASVAAGAGTFNAIATTPGTYNITLGADAPGVIAVGTTVQAVAPTVPTLTWGATPTLYTDASPFAIAATSDSSAPITYSFVSGPAKLSGNMVTLGGTVGTIVLQATQPAQGFYAAGQSTLTLQVLPLIDPGLSLAPVATHTFGDAPLSLTALSHSDAPVTYSIISGPAVVSGSALQLTGAGTVVFRADQPVSGSYSAASAQQSFQVNPAPLTVTADSFTRAYGAANPTFTGSFNGLVSGDTLTESFSSSAVAASTPGTYAITPAATGSSLSHYTLSAQPGTLTVTKAGVSLQLATSVADPVGGQPVPYTITVAPQFAGVPTGSVTLFVDGIPYSSAPLGNGQGTIAAQFSAGQHTISAQYSGDSNFAAGATANSTTAAVAVPEFTVATGSTIVPYTSSGASIPIQLTPQSGTFYAPVALNIAGDVPTGFSASMSPAQVPAGSAAASVAITLSPAQPVTSHVSRTRNLAGALLTALLLPALALTRKRLPALAAILVFAAITTLGGCGGSSGSGQSSTPHLITVTAQSAGVSHQLTLTLYQTQP